MKIREPSVRLTQELVLSLHLLLWLLLLALLLTTTADQAEQALGGGRLYVGGRLVIWHVNIH